MIQATCIGQPLARFLQTPRASRVVARFDSTLQLESDDGQLWAITARNNAGAFRAQVSEIPRAEIGEEICLRYDSAARFDPRPARRFLTSNQKRNAARLIAREIHDLPDALGAWEEIANVFVIARSAEGVTKQTPSHTGIASLTSFARNDVIVHRLLGRGPGLTPTGDDFLQAWLVTLASGDEIDRRAFHSRARVIAPDLSRTTKMSAQFLREALNGWAFGALKDLLDDLPRVNASRVKNLLNIGASSGTAYALGVLFGLSWKI
ncbi:MAG: DUF2877 domain-containing protein [Chloroflexi bacterium]|nr:DUF2877 domain-containing protein [Chloroflexota bacterium]